MDHKKAWSKEKKEIVGTAASMYITSEEMCMKRLSKEEASTVKEFLKVPIPAYILAYSDGQFDLLDCYEVAFTFAIDLLRGRKVDPNASPWGDGQSVIFDPGYARLLLNIRNANLSADINNYCDLFLKVLALFKAHLVS